MPCFPKWKPLVSAIPTMIATVLHTSLSGIAVLKDTIIKAMFVGPVALVSLVATATTVLMMNVVILITNVRHPAAALTLMV